jgi:hypothetical protein
MATDFFGWINDNNPPEGLEYRKGFWDYVEFIQRLMHKHEVEEAEVVGTYLMKTPPPVEELLMPVVKITIRSTTFVVKYDLGVWPERWTVSVSKGSPYTGFTFGLFDERTDLRLKAVSGFDAKWLFPPFCENPAQFTCELGDEWDVAMFFRLISYES